MLIYGTHLVDFCNLVRRIILQYAQGIYLKITESKIPDDFYGILDRL